MIVGSLVNFMQQYLLSVGGFRHHAMHASFLRSAISRYCDLIRETLH